MKYITILLLATIIISCSKSKKTSLIEQDKSSASLYFERYKLSKEINKVESESDLNKSYEKVKLQKNDLNTRSLLCDIVTEYNKNNNIEKLNLSSKFLIQLSSKIHDSLNLGKAFRFRGIFFYKTQQLDSSYYFYLKAEKIYTYFKDNENYAKIVMNKGIIQYEIGDYLGADLSFNKAQSIFKQTNNYERIYSSLNQLGLVAIELKEYEKGVFYFDKAIESIENLQKEYDRVYYKTVCQNNIGFLYLKSAEYRKGIHYFEEALKNKKIKEEDPLLYSNLIDNLAYCRLKSNISTDLPSLLFNSLSVRKKINYSAGISTSNIHLSEYYFYKKDFKKAILYSQNAIEIAKKEKNPLEIISALKQASIVDKINASKYTDDYIRISDSLQLAERKNKDRFARIELETEEIRQERDDFEVKSKINFYYLIGSALFFLVLIIIRTQHSRAKVLALKQSHQKANEEIYKLIIAQQGKLQEGREIEKSRIAKELHDGVLGRLFGLRLNLDGLNSRTEDEAIEMRMSYLNELKLIEQDLREISHELSREKRVLINNFVSIINNLIEEQSKIHRAIIKIKVQSTIDWEKLSNITKINLYRILQESLQNINKHAEAKTVKININMDKINNLVLKIVDDGKGFNVDSKKSGIGMKNILARVNECEGILNVKSEINKGTEIKVIVPFNPQVN